MLKHLFETLNWGLIFFFHEIIFETYVWSFQTRV